MINFTKFKEFYLLFIFKKTIREDVDIKQFRLKNSSTIYHQKFQPLGHVIYQ